jgi:hypothetical protein
MASHRCGIGECKCNCKECLNKSKFEKIPKVQTLPEDNVKVDDSAVDYWVGNSDEELMTEFTVPSTEDIITTTTSQEPISQIETSVSFSSSLECPDDVITTSSDTVQEEYKCYYSLDSMNLTDDEEIMKRIHNQFECDSFLVCVKYGSHPKHRGNKAIPTFDTS